VRFAKKRSGTPGGFTLLELMIVIAIIGALLSILLPVIQSARESARKVVCLSNLSQIGKTMRTYAADFNGWIPRACLESEKRWPHFRPWVIAFDYELNRLPLDQIALSAAKFKVLRCPSAPQSAFATRPGDYLINAFVVGPDTDRIGGRVYLPGLSKIDWVRYPSQVVLMTDLNTSFQFWTDDPKAWPLFDRFGNPRMPGEYLTLMEVWHRNQLPGYAQYGGLVKRVLRNAHGRNQVNALYFDGSVRTVDSMELRVSDFDDGFRGKRPHVYEFEDIWW
jgi:prepilin-type N-terminal cleavage/methylation domain-containing protein/prepilin-type processing-associated H-X9-DG protein